MDHQKFRKTDIYDFLKEELGLSQLSPQSDIFGELGVRGDDFDELMEKYQKQFKVNMDAYLWYFHSDEEGLNFPGGLFFKPPYERVNRIPVNPELLVKFAQSGTWQLDYPEHQIPKWRYDILMNSLIGLILFTFLIIGLIYNYL
ncbi:MAG: DUF1493 family protein [Bacteroidota bacterium]